MAGPAHPQAGIALGAAGAELSAAPPGALRLAAYGAVGLPLALAALPVYLHVPRFYTTVLGADLALVGAVLLAARLLDALADPLLGLWSDRHAGRRGRGPLLLASAPPLAIGVLLLLNPGWRGDASLALWLALSLALVYLPYSLANINHMAWGAELSRDYHQRTRITAVREGWTLAGVLLASAAPAWLMARHGEEAGMAAFAALFAPVLLAAAALTAFGTPAAPRPAHAGDGAGMRALLAPLANGRFRWLMAAFVLDGFALAVSSTLFLFFVGDVLGAEANSPAFLGLYFAAGAASLPLWTAAARHMGKKRAWVASILASVAVFGWAFLLGPGDAQAFYAVCLLSGLCLGANLALPASLLADVMDRDPAPREGLYFGVWTLAAKLNLALAAGLALPLLAILGYQPGTAQPAAGALAAVYALVPCVAKLAAAWLLWRSPLDAARDFVKERNA